ncbi:MAG: hypothetical protein RBR09_01910 [Desulfobulbaceae bacterium]|nr:hypothetical protein [Desulfobulbaceae bacterium]MDY0349983.1 hypothetical protein [Desulfobulbaceae bacterium]
METAWEESRYRGIPALSFHVVRTARLLGTASATASGGFFHLHFFLDGFTGLFGLLCGFLYGFLDRFSSLLGLFLCYVGCLLNGFFSTTCAGLAASSAAAGGMRGGHGHAAGAHQCSDSESGEEFFQVLAVHPFSSMLNCRVI